MQKRKTNRVALLILAIVAIVCGVFALRSGVQQTVYDANAPVLTTEIGDETLIVPSWNLFKQGNLWNLVSSVHTISLTYTPSLADVTIAHAPPATQISTTIAEPLSSMIRQAASDGIALMLSSAYRSADDQQAIYNSLQNLYGRTYAHEYVAEPGASEHQTGLAVDFASVTHGCTLDANACSLDASAIAWLRTHAAEYGFIERYPSGKQSITGVAGEHWHYRYVGVPLAKALDAANMTLDEFVSQVAPGYAK